MTDITNEQISSTEKRTSETRDITFDIARGIGFLCVVLGHTGGGAAFRAVYPFHMPLFFLISGWFLKRNLPAVRFALRKLKQLLPLYLFIMLFHIIRVFTDCYYWGLSQQIPNMLRERVTADLYCIALGSNKTLLGSMEVGSVGLMWFLPALFWGLVFTRLVLNVPKLRAQAGIVILLFVLSMESVKLVWLPFGIQTGGCAALFIYIGWLTANHLLPYIQKNHAQKTASLGKLLLAASFAAWLFEALTGIIPDMCQNKFPYPVICVLCSTVICFGVLYGSKLFASCRFAKPLSLCGRYTLVMLVMHLIETESVFWDSLFPVSPQFGLPGKVIHHIVLYLFRIALISLMSYAACRFRFMRILFGYEKRERS